METQIIVNGFPVIVKDPVSDFVVKQKKSSNVEYFGFGSNRDVFVQFRSGESYIYKDVSSETIQGMIEAESIGKFVSENIVKKYLCVRHEYRFVVPVAVERPENEPIE